MSLRITSTQQKPILLSCFNCCDGGRLGTVDGVRAERQGKDVKISSHLRTGMCLKWFCACGPEDVKNQFSQALMMPSLETSNIKFSTLLLLTFGFGSFFIVESCPMYQRMFCIIFALYKLNASGIKLKITKNASNRNCFQRV